MLDDVTTKFYFAAWLYYDKSKGEGLNTADSLLE